jgi:hypothetical protein
MTREEAIHLIEWLQKTPTAKQFYGIIPEELLRYYEEQNQALRIHDVVGRSEQFYCAEWNKVGYVCEEGQCDKCRKTESM